jgi:CRISPR/Cas system-associated exonuclease Cas4 (RecB family)
MCQYAYHLSYDLGLKGFNNSGALKGTICHETIERIATECSKTNSTKERENILNGYIDVLKEVYYKHDIDENVVLGNEDKIDCINMLKKILFDRNADYFSRNIIGIEKKFDFIISKDGNLVDSDIEIKASEIGLDDISFFEAFYNGTGAFRIYGIIDFIVETDSKTIEVVDWKTSKKAKTYKELCDDLQITIYNMIARKLFPDYENYIMTMYYARKAPISIMLDAMNIEETANMLESRWREIRSIENPARNIKPYNKWKCNYCAFKRDENDYGACKRDCDLFYFMEQNGADMTKYKEAVLNGIRLETI